MVKSAELVARLARVAQALVGAALRLELGVQAKASEVRLGGCQGRRRGRGLERRVSARSGRVRRLGQRGRRRRRRRGGARFVAGTSMQTQARRTVWFDRRFESVQGVVARCWALVFPVLRCRSCRRSQQRWFQQAAAGSVEMSAKEAARLGRGRKGSGGGRSRPRQWIGRSVWLGCGTRPGARSVSRSRRGEGRCATCT